MNAKNAKNKVGKNDDYPQLDVWSVLWTVIGGISSWINMLYIESSMQIPAYLSIIFTTIIPGVIIALFNRYWGYGYLIGFSLAGIPFSLIIDLFIGWYTFFTAVFIFIILWLIFWKAWRSLSGITTSG
ncbi:MAG: hypothetical protein ACOC44_08125 [Promethearchaeia archaeon]